MSEETRDVLEGLEGLEVVAHQVFDGGHHYYNDGPKYEGRSTPLVRLSDAEREIWKIRHVADHWNRMFDFLAQGVEGIREENHLHRVGMEANGAAFRAKQDENTKLRARIAELEEANEWNEIVGWIHDALALHYGEEYMAGVPPMMYNDAIEKLVHDHKKFTEERDALRQRLEGMVVTAEMLSDAWDKHGAWFPGMVKHINAALRKETTDDQ